MLEAAAGESGVVPMGTTILEAGSAASNKLTAAEGILSLDAFDLDRVLEMGTPLLASGGQASPPVLQGKRYDLPFPPNFDESANKAQKVSVLEQVPEQAAPPPLRVFQLC